MPTLIVVTEDKMIGVDGVFVEVDYDYPVDLWAIQWDGSAGVAEYTDQVVVAIQLVDVQPYIDAHAAELTRLYEVNKDDRMNSDAVTVAKTQRASLLADTDWWVLPDRTPTQAQLDYRTALRDLPAQSSWNPHWVWNDTSTDRNEHHAELSGVTWPKGGN